jgi:glycosyltransferase involved in cell wall biosynthesis
VKRLAIFSATPQQFGGGYEAFASGLAVAARRNGYDAQLVNAPPALFRGLVAAGGRGRRFAHVPDTPGDRTWIRTLRQADVVYAKLEVLDLFVLRPIVDTRRLVAGVHTPLIYPRGFASPLRQVLYSAPVLRLLLGRARIHALNDAQLAYTNRLRRPTLVVANGVRRPRRVTLPNDGPRAIFVGRLSEEKGVDRLAAVLASGIRSLTICGDGPLRGIAESLERTDERVRYTGWLTAERIAQEMERSNLLLLPSLWESMPLAALAALRTGMPVVASDLPVTRWMQERSPGIVTTDFDSAAAVQTAIGAAMQLLHDSGRIADAADGQYDDVIQYDRLLRELFAAA